MGGCCATVGAQMGSIHRRRRGRAAIPIGTSAGASWEAPGECNTSHGTFDCKGLGAWRKGPVSQLYKIRHPGSVSLSPLPSLPPE